MKEKKKKEKKSLEFEPKVMVHVSDYVTKEDLYRMICGVKMLGDGLLACNLQTCRERGADIELLAHKLDVLAQRVKDLEESDGPICLQLVTMSWKPSVAEETNLALAK